jgi:mannose-6-phosphate isomerase
MKLYPLHFEPIFKERIWGGEQLKNILQKPIKSKITGESWELSAVEGSVSIVSNGSLKGKSLSALLDENPLEILGATVYEKFGAQFPLLFKYLDAKQDLSIQVHPNDALAKKRHNSFGKTEMWYVMKAEPASRIIVGFKEDSSAAEYLNHLNDGNLISILNEVVVEEGDAFLLETGTVHAIGAGLLIAEIQQTSDITYRLYDFDRTDADGNKRELHIDLALEAINYEKGKTSAIYTKEPNQANVVIDCPYFTTNFVPLEGEMQFIKKGNSFTVYMCVEGFFTITYAGVAHHYKKGDTILLPAVILEYIFIGKASILEIYIS